MAKLTDDEQKMLDELSAKRDAPDEPDYGDGVIVLSGRRADDFLSRVFGGGSSESKAGKGKPPAAKGGKAGKPAPDDDQADEDDDEDDEDDEIEDPPAGGAGHRYFGGK